MSTAGLPQVQALQSLKPSLKIDNAEAHNIRFGAGDASSIGVVRLPTILGTIPFHVLQIPTPFLLSITDMDRLGAKFDNLQNMLIQGDMKIPIIRRWGHPWWVPDAKPSMAFTPVTSTGLDIHLSTA